MSVTVDSSVEVRLDVRYGGGHQGTLCNDLYLPAGAGPHPALLCLHGGAWLRGSQRQYSSWGPYLAARGFAVVAVDYRLTTQVSPAWPGVYEDVCRAWDWMRDQASSLRIDVNRLGTVGDSVGALMAAILSLDEERQRQVRAMVGVYGIYDLIDWWTLTQPPRRTDDPVGRLMGTTPAAARAAYESFSPLHRVEAKGGSPSPAYLIIHGDSDGIVHHNQSERFTIALRESKADVESMILAGAGHHWFTVAADNPARRRVEEEPNVTVAPVLLGFLERTLGRR